MDEIVTSCIKGEEQYQAILLYLNNLTSEIDDLEEMLKSNITKINIIEGSKHQGKLNFQEFIAKNENNYYLLQQKFFDKEKRLKEISEIITALLPMLMQLYTLLLSMNFTPCFNQNLYLEAIEKLNQENLNNLLGQIEEFINFLLIAVKLKSEGKIKTVPDIKTIRSVSNQKSYMLDILEEKDLYDEDDFEDIKVPISIEEMKTRAFNLVEKRRNLLKTKTSTHDTGYIKTQNNYSLSNEDL